MCIFCGKNPAINCDCLPSTPTASCSDTKKFSFEELEESGSVDLLSDDLNVSDSSDSDNETEEYHGYQCDLDTINSVENIVSIELAKMQIKKSSSASSKKVIEKSVKLKKIPSENRNILKKDSKKVKKINGKPKKEENFEKRIMMKKETQESLDFITNNFFYQSFSLMKNAVKSMSHSKRFWLCVKFYDSQANEINNYSIKKLCDIFGISRACLFKHVRKIKRENLTIEDYDGFSPVECEKVRQRFFNTFKKFASNFDELVAQGLIHEKHE